MESLELAQKIADEALNTKGKDLKVLDLRRLISYTDYFIFVSATSDRHAKALADRVYLKIKKDLGKLPLSFEGHATGRWVLMDYGDVVLHIFLPEQRNFYGLDALWAKAPRVSLPGEEEFFRLQRKKHKAAAKKKSPKGKGAKRKPAHKKGTP